MVMKVPSVCRLSGRTSVLALLSIGSGRPEAQGEAINWAELPAEVALSHLFSSNYSCRVLK